MEYRFKLAIEEYSMALKLLNDINPGRNFIVKLVRRCVLGFCLFLTIVYTVMYGLKGLLLFGSICSVMLGAFFYFLSPKQVSKKRLKIVKKQVNADPSILDWQVVKIEEGIIEYIFNEKSLRTKLSSIDKIIEEDGVILVLDVDGDMCAIIPCSQFRDLSEKSFFLNIIKNK